MALRSTVASLRSSHTVRIEGLMDTNWTNKEKTKICKSVQFGLKCQAGLEENGQRERRHGARRITRTSPTRRDHGQHIARFSTASHFPLASWGLDDQLLKRFLKINHHRILLHNPQVLTFPWWPTARFNNFPSTTGKRCWAPQQVQSIKTGKRLQFLLHHHQQHHHQMMSS